MIGLNDGSEVRLTEFPAENIFTSDLQIEQEESNRKDQHDGREEHCRFTLLLYRQKPRIPLAYLRRGPPPQGKEIGDVVGSAELAAFFVR